MQLKFRFVILLLAFPVIVFSQSQNLDYYIKAGLQNSPLLHDYSNQINASLVDSLLIRASKLPQVEGRSQLLYAPAYTNFGYDEVVTDGGNYTGVVGVTQTILNRKEMSNRYNSVNLQRQSITNSTRISVAELKRMITSQYLAAYSDFNELKFNRSFLDLANRESEIVHQFMVNGLCKQTDYLSLEIEKQTQEILVNQLENLYRKDIYQLNQLCGLKDTSYYSLILPDLEVSATAEINTSPLFLQYKIDSLRIENEIAAVDVRYLPKINWFADAGFLSSTPFDFYRHFGYSAGLSLTIPIYDGHQKNQEKQKLSLEENTRSAYQINFKNQYDQQIRQLTEELKTLRVLSARLEKQKTDSQQLVSALRGQLEAGNIQMSDYINAVRTLRSINKSLSDNNIRIQNAINEMNYLVTK